MATRSNLPSDERPYHHGSLRSALVDAGVELARVDGPSGVGLRAATRLAGVSQAAAYRHFADRDDLLASVSLCCVGKLGDLMQQRIDAVRRRDPQRRAWERMYAIGQAYVEFATEETGWFRTAFVAVAHPTVTLSEIAAKDASPHPLQLLSERLDELTSTGGVPSERRPGLEYAAWSAVHGFSTLLVDGPLAGLDKKEQAAALTVVLDVISRGL